MVLKKVKDLKKKLKKDRRASKGEMLLPLRFLIRRVRVLEIQLVTHIVACSSLSYSKQLHIRLGKRKKQTLLTLARIVSSQVMLSISMDGRSTWMNLMDLSNQSQRMNLTSNDKFHRRGSDTTVYIIGRCKSFFVFG